MGYLTKEALERATFPVAGELLGAGTASLVTLPGGASIRHYHRITIDSGKPLGTASGQPTRLAPLGSPIGSRSLLVMELGDDPLKSEEASKGVVRELPFLNVQRYLARAGVAVPEVYRYDSQLGLVYLEDLGDVTFESRVLDADDEARGYWYGLAIEQLVTLQKFAAGHPDPDCIAFSRGFDFELLKWELDHFREYGLEAVGHHLTPAEHDEVERHFVQIAERLASAPRIFVHRDYQSRNLMVQSKGPGTDSDQLRVIDFQDALLGTSAYDLVGLLRDSYVALSVPLCDRLVDLHARKAGHDRDAFRALFDLQTIQRKLKDAGRFVFIDRVKKNPSFLVHIPNSLAYVRNAFSRVPDLGTLQEILARYIPDLK